MRLNTGSLGGYGCWNKQLNTVGTGAENIQGGQETSDFAILRVHNQIHKKKQSINTRNFARECSKQ